MGFALYDKVNLAMIAYANVKANGTVVAVDGVNVVKTGPGTYELRAPVDIFGKVEPLFAPSDLCLATLRNFISGVNARATISVYDGTDVLRAVVIQDAATGFPADSDFVVTILRTLATPLPPP